MPTRDEDWWSLIKGDKPDDPISYAVAGAADAWHVFEAFTRMDSAEATHDAIARADDQTVRRALLGAVVSRVGTPLSPEQRVEWMKRDATAEDQLRMFDFPPGE